MRDTPYTHTTHKRWFGCVSVSVAVRVMELAALHVFVDENECIVWHKELYTMHAYYGLATDRRCTM